MLGFSAGWHESPHTLAGGVDHCLFRQNQFSAPGDPQVVLLILVHDDDLAFTLKEMIAFYARFLNGRCRRSGSDLARARDWREIQPGFWISAFTGMTKAIRTIRKEFLRHGLTKLKFHGQHYPY